jgi:DNA-binding MarR family transcriptional regulator
MPPDQRSLGTVYLLKRAELAVRGCMEVALADFDLTPTQFLMLFRLAGRQEVSGAELAREVGVRPQSVIETLAPLERKGLLKREASSANRRVLHTQLTPAGRKLLDAALRTAAQIESELLADLNGPQLAALQQALTQLWERAERHELHPGVIRARAEQQMRTQLAARQRRSVRDRSRSNPPQRTRTR